MKTTTTISRSAIYRVLNLLIPLLVLIYSVYSPGIDGYERARLGDMVVGKAYRPYVYRTLVPSVVRVIKTAVPRGVRIDLSTWVETQPGLSRMIDTLKWDVNYLIETLFVLFILYLSLLAFAAAMKYLIEGLSLVSRDFADTAALFSVACLPLLFKYYNYIYDFPQLFLFTLGLGLIARRKWDLFLVVYLFACFNKETTILLSMVFFLQQIFKHKEGWKSFFYLCFCQGAIFILSRLILTILFRENPGSMVEFHLYDYNMILFRKFSWRTLLLWLPPLFLVFYRWFDKPELLRKGIWILVPLVGLTLFFGFLDELRDYYEAYPIVFLLMAYSVAFLLKIPVENRRI